MVNGLFNSEVYVMGKRLLDAAALRHEALASNIANVETPGYKRIDISKDFDVQLKLAARQNDIAALQRLTPTLTEDKTAAAVRPDGNNVLIDRELMEINRNGVEYEFLTQYMSSNLQRLQTALRTTQ